MMNKKLYCFEKAVSVLSLQTENTLHVQVANRRNKTDWTLHIRGTL